MWNSMTLLGGLTGIIIASIGVTCLALHLDYLSPQGQASTLYHIPPPPCVVGTVQVETAIPVTTEIPPTRAVPKVYHAPEQNISMPENLHYHPLKNTAIEIAN
jgi:hypothetical protein